MSEIKLPLDSNGRENSKKTKQDQISSNVKDVFLFVPDDILLLIFSYITDGNQLGKLTRVNKRWKNLIDNFDAVWKKVVEIEYHLRESDFEFKSRFTLKHTAKDIYVAHKTRIQFEQRHLQVNEAKKKNETTSAEFQRRILQWYGQIGDYINLILFVAFSALLARKLDGTFTQNWYIVFVPLYIISFFTIFYVIGFDINIYRFGTNLFTNDKKYFSIGLLANEGDRYVNAVFGTFTSSAGRILTWIYCLLIIAWFFMLPAFAENPKSMSVSLLLFPPIAVNVLSVITGFPAFIFIYLERNTTNRGSMLLLTGIMMALGSVVLMSIGLIYGNIGNEDQYSWHFPFIPIYILEFFIIPCYFVILISLFPFDSNPGTFFGCTGWFVVLPCLIAFQVLIAKKFDGTFDKSFVTTFIPLYLLEGLGFVWKCISF